MKTVTPEQATISRTDKPIQPRRGLRRLGGACFHSFEGLAATFRHEEAFRQEALLAAVLIPVACATPANGLGKALMVAAVLLVLIVELLNSAIEAAVDRISSETHPLAKRAKDTASAAVFVSLINVPVVWLLVLAG
jgi:diacylglycerol kinase (ATP)